jgi:flagellar protein FlaG
MDIRPTGNTAQPALEKQLAAANSVAAAKAAAVAQPPASEPSLAQVTQAVNSINKAMSAMSQNLEFSVDSDSQRTIVKVVDQQTKEVLRQIPSLEALEIAKALDHAMQGMLIRQKA